MHYQLEQGRFFYFIHCSLGTQPGSAMGEKGIRYETAKKSASEANRAVDWGAKRAEELRQPPPFSLPKLPLGSLRSPFFFFFFCFFPSLWSLIPGYIYSRRFINLYQEPHSAPVYIEKYRRTLFRKRGLPPAEPWREVVP